MKGVCAFAFFAFYYVTSFSQTNNEDLRRKYILEANSKVSQFTPFGKAKTNKPAPENRLSFGQLKSPKLLKDFINAGAQEAPAKKNSNNLPRELPQTLPTCRDTSFVLLLHTTGSWIYVQKMVPTADDGTLILGLIYDTTKANFIESGYALIIKADNMGNVSWIKEFDDPTPGTFFTFFMFNAFELSNKDIVCVGSIDTTAILNNTNTIAYRLTSDGKIIWQKGLHTTLVNTYPQISININSLAEGLNGDLFLSGTTESNGNTELAETIIRLDKSGNLIWDANYGNATGTNEGAEGLAVYFQNGQLLEVGLSHGNDNASIPSAVNFLTLDYNTGNILKKRFYRPDYADKNVELNKTFTYYYNQCTRLSDGHFIISGKLFSDFLHNTPIIDHFGVMEFNASFDPVNAYTVSSPLHTNYFNNNIFFNEKGKGLILLFQYINRLNATLYYGAFENQQFLNQRKKSYNNIALPEPGSFRYTVDNGYVYTQSYFEGGSNTFIEFIKMHNSDTSSACLGTPIFLMQFLPLHIIEDMSYASLTTNINHKVEPVNYTFTSNDTLQVLSSDPCKQLNSCDSIKIRGNAFCGSQASVVFTSYKNAGCGGITQWKIDSTAIDSLRPQNDSAVLIHFKNINWQGNLYASLPGGKCIVATDSMPVTIIKLHDAINLGPDTLLCKGNKMILHAGKGFTIYKWQNGSGDSIFTVTKPGKYFVSATDKCGNKYSDTINIGAADFAFSIGNDTALCNNIPVRLTATPGFEKYTWQPAYKISADTGQSVIVSPTVDTFYIAIGQKWPGCIFSDTVHVRILTSATVRLGNDTSICANQSITLDAGAGFINYSWSTGAASRSITLSRQGTYFVEATAANSCTSSDTILILNIGPPFQILGNDTTLCQETIYTYNFNLPGATYLWNDGSTGSDYRISKGGVYSLTVVQQGCTVKDTVVIGYKNNPIFSLGNDTTLCRGNTLAFDLQFHDASYVWQDGSTLDDFLVTATGLYYVSVNLNGCIASDTIAVNYLDVPKFTLGRDRTICHGETIILRPALQLAATYLWQDGSTAKSFSAKDTGTYNLQVSNICGTTSEKIVFRAGLCDVVFPNAFTPNGDGLNDIFRVKYTFTVKAYHLTIFNRYGQKVFESIDMSNGWDGNFNGIPQSPDIYVWVAQITGLNGVEKTDKGIITLLK